MDRRKVIFGFGLVIAVLSMIGPPWFIWAPLIALGLFLMAWGASPKETEAFVRSLPHGPKIWSKLARFESQLFADAKKTEDVRLQLAEFITQGTDLMRIIAKADGPVPLLKIAQWIKNISDYLEKTEGFGKSYVVRLGTVSGANPGQMGPGTASPEHRAMYSAVSVHVIRLQEFLRELPRG